MELAGWLQMNFHNEILYRGTFQHVTACMIVYDKKKVLIYLHIQKY